jgi:hypothetical protein
VQEAQNDGERDDSDRDVDQEDPTPSGDEQHLRSPGEQAADQRADDARDAEHREKVALVLGALARREHVAHDREREGHQTAGAETLNRAETGELEDRRREARRDRSDQEDDDRDDEQWATPEDVAQLAVDRGRNRRHDQVRGSDPCLLAETVEIVGDGADRGADHGLIEGGEEHSGHQAEDDEQNLAVGHLDRHRGTRGGRGCCGVGHSASFSSGKS